MKQDSRYDESYIYSTCSTSQLEIRTHEGWELVEFLTDSFQMMGEEKESIPGNEHNNWCHGEKTHIVMGAVTHTNYAVIRRKRGEYSQVKQLQEGLESQRASNGELAKEVDELKKTRNDLSDKLEKSRIYANSRDEALTARHEQYRKLECDLRKLRQHFGEKAVKEALES